MIYNQQFPPNDPYVGVVMAVEDNEWLFTLGTINKHKLPRNQEDIFTWLKEKNMPELLEKVRGCKFLSGPYLYSKEGNEFTYFHKIVVDGYVAVGDSVANFNPTYAQGMSTAADAVLLLDDTIRRGLKRNWCSDFQKQLCRQLTPPYLLASFGDLRFAGTETDVVVMKRMLPIADFMVNRITDMCEKNKYVYVNFLKVVGMTEGYLWVFFSPRFMWNLL